MSENEVIYPEVAKRLNWIRLNLDGEARVNAFAEKHGWSRQRVQAWEKGTRKPLPEEAAVYVRQYGVDLDFIYMGRVFALPQNVLKLLESNPLEK